MMLFISFVAIVLACILLWIELNKWGKYPWWNTNDAKPKSAFRSVGGQVFDRFA